MEQSAQNLGHKPQPPAWLSWLYIGIIIVVASVAAGVIWWAAQQTIDQTVRVAQNQAQVNIPVKSAETPQLTTEEVVGGRDHVWEIAFLPSKEMLFTERKGTLSVVKDGVTAQLAKIDDTYAFGEGGLLGMAIDPDFTANRHIYLCMNSNKGGAPDVRVVRWRVKDDLNGMDGRGDIITGIPSNTSGRHSGCRLAFGPDGYLWVGTGDAAQGDTSIRPKSLGGKVLRVDRDGKAVPGNVGGDYDSRIYSYGHRNVQALAFFSQPKNGVLGINVEHGSTVDDEVNPLVKGNFGWAPPTQGYNENGVPMTDKTRFPDAIDAMWSSGNPTQAPSGATMLSGRQWKAWDGVLAVAVLKDTHLKVLHIDPNLKITKEEKALVDTFGRLRTAVQGPDGNLYIGTDNGNTDKIIRVVPN